MGGGSVSSLSHLKAKSTMSAPGIMHLTITEMNMLGAEQVKKLGGGLTGLTAEMDAIFQVCDI